MNLLHVPAGSPWWLFVLADLILFLHIAGGGVGIVSGMIAVFARKGGRTHRVAGTVFFVSMLVMATIGAAASPFLPVPEMANVVAGCMTVYLLVTAWRAARDRDGRAGRFELAGFVVALGLVVAGAMFAHMAAISPTGTVGKTPPQAFYVFMIVGGIAAAGDLHLLLRGRMSGPARIARHLWRMCTALTVASGSFFLGQQKIMPIAMRGSPWLFVPVLVPLLLLLFWLVRVRIGNRFLSPSERQARLAGRAQAEPAGASREPS